MRIEENNCVVNFKWTAPRGGSPNNKFKYSVSIRNAEGKMIPAPVPCYETEVTQCQLRMSQLSLNTGDAIIGTVKTCLKNGFCL